MNDFTDYMIHYLEELLARNYDRSTVLKHRRNLLFFFSWAKIQSYKQLAELGADALEKFVLYLQSYQKEDGTILTSHSKRQRLSSVKLFFAWLLERNVILYDPIREMPLPPAPKSLPKDILTTEEISRIIKQPNQMTLVGLRDRAMIEVFYATGIRRSEIANLEMFDLQASKGLLLIRQGKNRKDRLVPITERALTWVDKYLKESRPYLIKDIHASYLFLTLTGNKLSRNTVGERMRKYIIEANITKKGSCHIYRHTMATQMLANGASLRHIQEILGHAELETTQIYTKVEISSLRKVYEKTNASALLGAFDEAN